tara:strand:- start:703 stop:966 length:264 start_codon:yes stop_codon:yes gene_type:complete
MRNPFEVKILEELVAIKRAINAQAQYMINTQESVKPLLTIKDIAIYSSMSEVSVRRAIDKKHLKPFKKDGKKLFKIENVNKWLRGAY